VTQAVTSHVERRPDGAEIHWEECGEGALVLVAHMTLWSYPSIYRCLIDDLSTDHRVLTYDPRGCGASTVLGPYEMDTDADDLQGILEAAGGGAVTIAVGDALNRAARVAGRRPDLIPHLIAIAPTPAAILPRSELTGSDVLGASESVIEMLLQLMTTDPRSALRTMISAVNPGLSEESLRERVERAADYLTPEAAVNRVRSWLDDDVSDHLRAIGERLWILYGGPDPLFEGVLAGRVRELLPEAHVAEMADGPISRPELTAGYVRALT
jgi:pimeloyl-ACP methyl ester carboxylesterase